MQLIIRSLQPDDHAQAVALWQASPGIRLRDEDCQAGFCAYLLRNPGLSLAGMLDDALVATVLVGHDGRRGYLHHLAVAGAAQGRGFARAMLEEAIRRLREQGICKVHVFALRAADESVSFWSKQAAWIQRDDIVVFSTQE